MLMYTIFTFRANRGPRAHHQTIDSYGAHYLHDRLKELLRGQKGGKVL